MKPRTLQLCWSPSRFDVPQDIYGGGRTRSPEIKPIMPTIFDNGYDDMAFVPSFRPNSTRGSDVGVVR